MTHPLHDHTRAALPRMILRGLFRRCAWCGSKGSFFTSWYKKEPQCQTCGINWERGYEGYELGAATMGVFMTFGSIIISLVVTSSLGAQLWQILALGGVLAVFVPIITYPLTYCVWQGVDLFIRPPSDEDIAQAEEWLKTKS